MTPVDDFKVESMKDVITPAFKFTTPTFQAITYPLHHCMVLTYLIKPVNARDCSFYMAFNNKDILFTLNKCSERVMKKSECKRYYKGLGVNIATIILTYLCFRSITSYITRNET